MQYNFNSYIWWHVLLSILKKTLDKVCGSNIAFIHNVFCQPVKNGRQFLFITFKHQFSFSLRRRLFPSSLVLALLILLCSFNSQAYTAITARAIEGSEPMLTYDDGRTRSYSVWELLYITFSNGSAITPGSNWTSHTNSAVLPNSWENLSNVGMLVPTNSDYINLTDIITSRNYWRDVDGDGEKGIWATGTLNLTITDRYGNKVGRNDNLYMCNAPYKVVLSGNDGELVTRYGVPNKSHYSGSSATYYISPGKSYEICWIRPNMDWNKDSFAGPSNIWDKNNGFYNQYDYNRNFPTTGMDGLYFDLGIGSGGRKLNWPSVERAGIKADMESNWDGSNVRVKLTGPQANFAQQVAQYPGWVNKPNLPQTFELVGYDGNGNAAIRYGFVIRKWYIHRAAREYELEPQKQWCANTGYRLVKVNDLTNAVCDSWWDTRSTCRGAVGATPSSSQNHLQRQIGAGIQAEWSWLNFYNGVGYTEWTYWTDDQKSTGATTYNFVVEATGFISSKDVNRNRYLAICVTP